MALLDPDGSLLYLGLPSDAAIGATPKSAAPAILERLAWDGQVLWSFDDPSLSHDFAELPGRDDRSPPPSRAANGAFGSASMVAHRAREADGAIWGNQIVEIDPRTNNERVVFDIAEAWQPEAHPLPDYMPRSEWTHANSILLHGVRPLDPPERA